MNCFSTMHFSSLFIITFVPFVDINADKGARFDDEAGEDASFLFYFACFSAWRRRSTSAIIAATERWISAFLWSINNKCVSMFCPVLIRAVYVSVSQDDRQRLVFV